MARAPLFYSIEGPLDTLPGAGQLRAANLHGFAAYVRRANGDPQRILARFGISQRALTDPDAHINAQSLVALFEYCAELFGDALFGLHLALGQGPDVFGCVSPLARSAPTLQVALESICEYLPYTHSPEASPTLHVGERSAELRWGVVHDLGVNDQANLQAAILQMKLLRELAGPRWTARYVNLSTITRPGDIAELEQTFACLVRPGSPDNAIGFPRQLLPLPLPSANRLIFRLIGGYLDRVRAANRETIVERVRDYIRGDLPNGCCSIERCSEKLDMSVRTLQMRLADEGTAFSEILESSRAMLAKAYLKRPESSLDEIAEWLGYGEQTSFGRAFRRWTGTTPKKYRSSLQSRTSS